MKFLEATISGTIEQAELLFLNMVAEKIQRPYSQKVSETTLPLQYEFEDVGGEWDRRSILKGLKKQKIIHDFSVFADTEYLSDAGEVKLDSVKIRFIPAVITKARAKKLDIVRGQNDQDTIEWGHLKMNKVTGRFSYYKTVGILSGKQKMLVLELLLKHKVSSKHLFRSMNPGARLPNKCQRPIGYVLKAVKEKLKTGKNKTNPDPFKNIRKWGYELV